MAGFLGGRPPLFSSDGRHMYVTRGSEVRTYAISTGSLIQTFRGHTGLVTGVAEHPTNARQLLTTSLDGTLRSWDTDDAACLFVINLGVPVTRLCAPATGPCDNAARAYVAVALRGGALNDDYPLGNEVGCLRPRPLATAFAFAVNASGRSRIAPRSAILEVDLALRKPTRRLGQAQGFIMGIDGRQDGLGGRVVVYAVRRRLYVWRANADLESLVVYRHMDRLTTCSLHPSDAYVVTGDVQGRLRTWFLPELLGPLTGATEKQPAMCPEVMDSHDETAAGAASEDGSGGKQTLLGQLRAATPARWGLEDVPSTSAHWHSHAVWGTAFSPDGSFLVSGGEEAVIVVWQLMPSGGGSGSDGSSLKTVGKGPIKSADSMTFFARVGAPVRGLAAFSAVKSVSTLIPALQEQQQVARRAAGSQLLFAFCGVDNSVALVNALTLRETWRVRSLSVGGLAAMPTVGVVNSLARYAYRHASKRGIGGSGAAGEGRFELSGDRGTLLHATTRFLRRGAVVDPRTRALVVNGLPGRATLQWYDARRDAHVQEVEVAPRNLVSRIEADPPPPTRVTHVAFSSDGTAMATLDVMDGLQAGCESITLRFWTRGADETFVLNTRVQAPHKTDVCALEFHPSVMLVVTGSRDRTFKLWDRVEAAPIVSLAHDQHTRKQTVSQRQLEVAESAVATAGQKRARSTGSDSKDAVDPSMPSPQRYIWQCRSVGFYRDYPCSAAAFSGDGTALALGYGRHVTLWDWRDNALKGVLVPPPQHGVGSTAAASSGAAARMLLPGGLRHGHSVSTLNHHRLAAVARGGDAEGGAEEEEDPAAPPTEHDIRQLAFAGLSSLLVAATASSVQCWNVLSCSLVWSFSASVITLAVDRIGLATSARIAIAAFDDATPPTALSSSRPGSLHKPPVRGQVHVVLLDAESPVPLAAWQLPCSRLSSNIDPSVLPIESQSAPLYALAFAPALALTPASSAPRTHDLLVLGPQNEIWRLPVGPAVATTAAPPLPSCEHEEAAVGGAPGVSQKQQRVVYAQGPRGQHPLTAGLNVSSNTPASAAPKLPTVDNADFATLLRTAGPSHTLTSSTALYEALIDTLLPPPVAVKAEDTNRISTGIDSAFAAGRNAEPAAKPRLSGANTVAGLDTIACASTVRTMASLFANAPPSSQPSQPVPAVPASPSLRQTRSRSRADSLSSGQ